MSLSLQVRKYFYSAGGSQAAIDTMLMAPVEAFLAGFAPDQLLRSRIGGALAVMGGVHLAAKYLRKQSIDYFGIKDNRYLKGLHDSLFFSLGNAAISGTVYYPLIAGCDRAETIVATGISSLAYLLGGWYIGKSMDKADTIKDDAPTLSKQITPRKQLLVNIAVSAGILLGSMAYANTRDKKETLEGQLEQWIEQQLVATQQQETTYQYAPTNNNMQH